MRHGPGERNRTPGAMLIQLPELSIFFPIFLFNFTRLITGLREPGQASQDMNKTSARQTSGSVQARREVAWMPTKHAPHPGHGA